MTTLEWGYPLAERPDVSRAHVAEHRLLRATVLPDSMRESHQGRSVIVTAGTMPHAAFQTARRCEAWMAALGLDAEADLGAIEDECRGDAATVRLIGSYRRASHRSYDAFFAIQGAAAPLMDNGRWTIGITSKDADGQWTLHHLNCNMRRRPHYGTESEAARGARALEYHPLPCLAGLDDEGPVASQIQQPAEGRRG